MNWIDAITLGIIGVLAALGAWSGLIKAIFRLLSVLLASVATWFGTAWISDQLSSSLSISPSTIKLVAGSALFLTTLVSVLILGNIISKLVAMTPMGVTDRIGGALLGILKASIICIVLLNLVLLVPIKGQFGKMVNSSIAISIMKHYELDPFDVNWDQIQEKSIQRIKTSIFDDANPLIPPKDFKKFDF